MKLTVTPLKRPSRAKRQGLHYQIFVQVDVLPKHAPTLVQYLVRQTTHLVEHCPMSYVPLFSALSDNTVIVTYCLFSLVFALSGTALSLMLQWMALKVKVKVKVKVNIQNKVNPPFLIRDLIYSN